MKNHARGTSLLTVVILSSACTTSSLGPESLAAVMLGEWSYAAPHRVSDPPILNAGVRVVVKIDSLEGARFWGRVTLWFVGDVGTRPDAFGRVSGRIDDDNGVTLQIPRTTAGEAAVWVAGVVAGDVLTVLDCHSGAATGPFPVGARFERIDTQ